MKQKCMEGTETRPLSLPSSRQDMGNNPIYEAETQQFFEYRVWSEPNKTSVHQPEEKDFNIQRIC